jgi:hypothetical protein
MLGSNEASALPEPLQIDFLWNVVLEPKRGHQDDADHEWVVRIFGPTRSFGRNAVN